MSVAPPFFPRHAPSRACVLAAVLVLGSGCASSGTAAPSSAPARAPATTVPPGRPNAAAALRTVAVLPLAGAAGAEGLGFAIAEILARDLALVPRVRVVERARLDAMQKEIGLAASGRIAPASAPRAGQLVGADRLLTGNVSRSGAGASIDVAMINVSTGVSEPVYSERVTLNGVIDAQERLAERAFQRLGVTLLPAERERLAKRPTRRVDALIAFGNGRRADALGNRPQARQFYAEAVRLDPQFQEARDASSDVVAAVQAATVPAAANATRPAFDLLMDNLLISVTDRVVRTVAPPAVCPPICPAVAGSQGSVIVVIRP